MSESQNFRIPPKGGVYALNLEAEGVCLVVCDQLDKVEPFCAYMAVSSSCTPLRENQIMKVLAKQPGVLVAVAESQAQLEHLLQQFRPHLVETVHVIACISCAEEDDVMALMNLGVHSIWKDLEDLPLCKASLLAIARDAARLRAQSCELQGVRETATLAMKAASEIGMLLQYLQQTAAMTDINRVLRASVTLLRNLNLQGCIACHFAGREYKLGTEGEISPIQESLLHSLVERVVQKGRILGLSSESSAWVCSGNSLADEVVGGRLRDILLQAVDILDAKIRSLEMIGVIREQHKQLHGFIEMLQQSQKDSQAATQQIMKRLGTDIELAAVTLDLNESQESYLLNLSNNAFDQLEQLFTGFNLLEQHFNHVLEGLDRARELADSYYHEGDDDSGEDDHDDSISLF